MRQARQQADDAREVVALPRLGIRAAEDHVFEQRRIEVGARKQTGDDLGREGVWAHAGERPFLREVEGRAGVGRNDGFHEGVPVYMMVIMKQSI